MTEPVPPWFDLLPPERQAYLKEPDSKFPNTTRLDWMSETALQLEMMAVLIRAIGELTAAIKKRMRS
jgi:hypothetical protein